MILSLRSPTCLHLCVTYIAEFALGSKQPFKSSYNVASDTFLIFDTTCPVALARANEHLLRVRCHGSVQVLLALDVQTGWHRTTGARWRWAGVDERDRGFRSWNLDGCTRCVALDWCGSSSCDCAPAATAEDEHNASVSVGSRGEMGWSLASLNVLKTFVTPPASDLRT